MKNLVTAGLLTLAITFPVAAFAMNENTDTAKGPVMSATGVASTLKTKAKDRAIFSRLKTKLFADEKLDDTQINVDVDDLVVSLRGTVNTSAQSARATMLAKGEKGVRSVKNYLTVVKADAPDSGVEGAGQHVENTYTRNAIKAKLLKDGLYEGNSVKVRVLNDTAVLTGSVKSWADYKKINQVAHEANGVDKVINKLKVTAKK